MHFTTSSVVGLAIVALHVGSSMAATTPAAAAKDTCTIHAACKQVNSDAKDPTKSKLHHPDTIQFCETVPEYTAPSLKAASKAATPATPPPINIDRRGTGSTPGTTGGTPGTTGGSPGTTTGGSTTTKDSKQCGMTKACDNLLAAPGNVKSDVKERALVFCKSKLQRPTTTPGTTGSNTKSPGSQAKRRRLAPEAWDLD